MKEGLRLVFEDQSVEKALDFHASRIVPVVHWSRKSRLNDIVRGLFRETSEFHGFNDVGIWPIGPAVDQKRLVLAERSGNRPRKTLLGKWAKTTFLKMQYNWCVRYLKKRVPTCLIVWNGVKGHRSLLAVAARDLKIPVVYLEEAPLPGRITVDFMGVNYGNSLPRTKDFYTRWLDERGLSKTKWRKLGEAMVPRGARGDSSVRHDDAPASLKKERFIFCPLQVPGDSQITIYGDWIRSVEHMIEVLHNVSRSLPDGWHLRLKEHPSSSVSYAEKLSALEDARFRVDNNTNTMQQIELSRAVLNVNSSVGLQAFFFDKPVIVLGKAFYTFANMAEKVEDETKLSQLLSDPEALSFDVSAREAFMAYLDEEYFPLEASVVAGDFTIMDVVKRDQRRDGLIEGL